MLQRPRFLRTIVFCLLIEMLTVVLLMRSPTSFALADVSASASSSVGAYGTMRDDSPTVVPTLPPFPSPTPLTQNRALVAPDELPQEPLSGQLIITPAAGYVVTDTCREPTQTILRDARPEPENLPEGELSGDMPQRPSLGGNLATNLAALVGAWTQSQTQALELAQIHGLEITGNFVAVTVTMESTETANAVKPHIRTLGGVITAEYDRWFDAHVPITALVEISSLPGVSLVQPVVRVFPVDDSGSQSESQDNNAFETAAFTHLTEGVAASNANVWHAAGITGLGVTVAILDRFTNIASLQAAGELPPPSRLTTLGTLQTSTHGSAVAEIVYDMAPGVNMILVSPTSGIEMATRIRELADYPDASRPNIITSSIGYYNLESGDGTGPVSDAIAYALSKGILFTQAAGNQARYNWQGTFSDTDGDNWLNFSGTHEINGLGYVSAETLLCVFMRWNGWPTTAQNYDLYLYYNNGETETWEIADVSALIQNGAQPPTEAITYRVSLPGYYGFAVKNFDATGNHVIDIMGHNSPAYDYGTYELSLIDPATSTSVFAVAAVNVVSPYDLEPYSSHGPAMGPGGLLAGGNIQPRISAYANVDTATVSRFNGTSAAAPHAAGAAALVWDAYPDYSVEQIKSFLESRAIPPVPPGRSEEFYDIHYGAGRLYLGMPPYRQAGIGIYARSTGDWYLRNVAGLGAPDYQLKYGGSWASPVVGDWNGDGTDSIGVYGSSNGSWHLRNGNSNGSPDIVVNGYGGWWGLPVVGDWNGDGIDTIGIFNPNDGNWYLRNSNSVGAPDINFIYGGSWGYPVVGDWDGDGRDTVGIYNPTNGYWYLRNSNSSGGVDVLVSGYGGWWGFPIVGDWDGDARDTIGLFAFQTGEWLLRNSNSSGSPDIYFKYGGPWGTPLAGNWNGPGSLAAELMAFSDDWNNVNQALGVLGTDYTLEDLLRFSLDPSRPPWATATPIEAVVPATELPLPTIMATTEIKPTPIAPMVTAVPLPTAEVPPPTSPVPPEAPADRPAPGVAPGG